MIAIVTASQTLVHRSARINKRSQGNIVDLVDGKFSERAHSSIDVCVRGLGGGSLAELVEVLEVVSAFVDPGPPFPGDGVDGDLLAAPLGWQHARWDVLEEIFYFCVDEILSKQKIE